jgi:hypothetical protein
MEWRPTVIARILTLLLVGLLVVPLAPECHPAEAKKKAKWKTVTRTFANNGQIAVPAGGTSGAANPYPAAIAVAAFKKYKRAKITDVDVSLRLFSHTDPDDLNLMLAFGNRRAVIMSDAGGATPVMISTLALDDEAATGLPDGDALEDGAFRPANHGAGADGFPAPAPADNGSVALSAFDGAKPDGQWRLFVYDDGAGDVGSFAGGWTLEITAKVKKKNKKKH